MTIALQSSQNGGQIWIASVQKPGEMRCTVYGARLEGVLVQIRIADISLAVGYEYVVAFLFYA